MKREKIGRETVYRYTFIVQGFGTFPVDMLRYDQCCFKYSVNLSDISPTAAGRPVGACVALRTYALQRLATSADWQPTFERWRSFGWNVVQDVHVGRGV